MPISKNGDDVSREIAEARRAPAERGSVFKPTAGTNSFWQENAPAAFFNELLTEREPQAQAAAQDRVHILDRCNRADV